jgi:hypothetical protein
VTPRQIRTTLHRRRDGKFKAEELKATAGRTCPPNRYRGPPMTLANMRENSAYSFFLGSPSFG